MRLSVDDVVELLLNGKVKIHELDEFLGDSNLAVEVRRKFIGKVVNIKFNSISFYSLNFNEIVGRNIENPIGVVQIPLGIAGPLKVDGEYAKGDFYIPLCTTEGALIASVNRGCKAITLSGGTRPLILRDYMARAPLFKTPSVIHAKRLVDWVKSNFSRVKEVAESTTRYGKLLDFSPYVVGKYVFLRFKFSTGDAMGMNMVTIAVDEIRKLIESEVPYASCVSLSGNLCVDKKPSALNLIEGRGKTVVCEAVVRKNIVRDVLKTTPEKIVDLNWGKNYVGSALASSLGFNAHFANIIAAIFVATGQDLAQIVESSMGFTMAEVLENGDLYISVTLPSLEVSTVGGGTRLPAQSEALSILGCKGGGDPPGIMVKKFAEIVVSTVLAGELSLLAALASHQLADAHKKLGRGGRS